MPESYAGRTGPRTKPGVEGSTATTLMPGFLDFKNPPVPVMVPPVPTPETRMSTFPPVSSQISGRWFPCARWIRGFTNCPGIKARGNLPRELFRLLNGSLHALGPLGQHDLGA
jgi:hypothetical protein